MGNITIMQDWSDQSAYLYGAWLAVKMTERESHARKAATIDDVREALASQAIVSKRIAEALEELILFKRAELLEG